MQVKLNNEVAKGIENIGASLLRASEDILARGNVVNGYGTIVRFDILHLIASQSLTRDKLGW